MLLGGIERKQSPEISNIQNWLNWKLKNITWYKVDQKTASSKDWICICFASAYSSVSGYLSEFNWIEHQGTYCFITG